MLAHWFTCARHWSTLVVPHSKNPWIVCHLEERQPLIRNIPPWVQRRLADALYLRQNFCSWLLIQWAYQEMPPPKYLFLPQSNLNPLLLESRLFGIPLVGVWTKSPFLHGLTLRVLFFFNFLADRLYEIKMDFFHHRLFPDPASHPAIILQHFQVLSQKPSVSFSIPACFEHLSL